MSGGQRDDGYASTPCAELAPGGPCYLSAGHEGPHVARSTVWSRLAPPAERHPRTRFAWFDWIGNAFAVVCLIVFVACIVLALVSP